MTRDVVGVIGAGRMGQPVIRRLVGHGHDVRVLVRSDATRDALAGTGIRFVGDPTGLAGCDVVLVILFDDDQVRSVCLQGGLAEVLAPGATIVVHTTCSPGTIAEIARRAADSGVHVVDCPFSGGPCDIAAGEVSLFAGGGPDVVARVRPVLSGYGNPVLHVGPTGAGQHVKLVNNALFAAQIGLLMDAFDLGTGLGVDGAALLQALRHGSADSYALGAVARRGSPTEFAAAIAEFLGKDVAVVRELAAETGGSLGVLAPALDRVGGVPAAARLEHVPAATSSEKGDGS